MKKFICWLSGHKPVVDEENGNLRKAHCSRCKRFLLGVRVKNDLTDQLLFWLYLYTK